MQSPPPAQGSAEAPLFEFSAFAPSDNDPPQPAPVVQPAPQQYVGVPPLQMQFAGMNPTGAPMQPMMQPMPGMVMNPAPVPQPTALQQPPPAYVPGTTPPGSRTSALGSASMRRQSDKSLFVSGLHPDCEFTHLHERFQQYGKIISCRVLRDAKTGNSRCIGYVNFANAADAGIAVTRENGLNGPQGGGPMTIRYAEDDPAFTPEETKKLFIRYVPLHFTPDQLRAVYSQFGTVTDCSVMPDISAAAKAEAQPWNMGYVTFSTAEEATHACARTNKTMALGHGHEIAVKPAESLATRAQRQRKHDGSTSSRTSYGMGSGTAQQAFGSGSATVVAPAAQVPMTGAPGGYAQPGAQQFVAPPGYQVAYLPTANGTLTPVLLPLQQQQQHQQQAMPHTMGAPQAQTYHYQQAGAPMQHVPMPQQFSGAQ